MNRYSKLGLAVCMILTASALLAGCTTSRIELVESGRAFEIETVAQVIDETDPGTLSRRSTDDAASLRSEALSHLRRQGDNGSQAADLLTRIFPTATRGVPYYIERATVSGQDAWIVVEATGKAGGPLEDRRLWALSDSGEVLFSATR